MYYDMPSLSKDCTFETESIEYLQEDQQVKLQENIHLDKLRIVTLQEKEQVIRLSFLLLLLALSI
jgi:hypothetical protein